MIVVSALLVLVITIVLVSGIGSVVSSRSSIDSLSKLLLLSIIPKLVVVSIRSEVTVIFSTNSSLPTVVGPSSMIIGSFKVVTSILISVEIISASDKSFISVLVTDAGVVLIAESVVVVLGAVVIV